MKINNKHSLPATLISIFMIISLFMISILFAIGDFKRAFPEWYR